MQKTISELNNFLRKNNPKKSRAFKVGHEKILDYAKKQVDAQLEIYNKLVSDKILIKLLMDFGKSYGARFNFNSENITAVALAVLVHLIFTKKINIKF